MTQTPRVAFFSDSYQEVNGVARTSRALATFAVGHDLPLLCVHGGRRTAITREGPVTRFALERGPMSLRLDRDLTTDLLHWRHADRVSTAIGEFGADVVHITGPSDMGQLGAWLAHRHGLPLVASWHTNVHEFATRRLARFLAPLPTCAGRRIWPAVERTVLRLAFRFYELARRILAPNPELIALLEAGTGRPVDLMPRGVDTRLFTPHLRTSDERIFRLGYVGRLSPEKEVRLLVDLERALLAAGTTRFMFVIVGEGSERPWLETHLQRAEFTGVRTGESLAKAYADMDLFVFPSETDTYGNVVLEAFASGVPVVAADRGGPKYLVRDGVSGVLVPDVAGFAAAILRLMSDTHTHNSMRQAARRQALDSSWDAVFEGVYDSYRRALRPDSSRDLRLPQPGRPMARPCSQESP